jgi:predicted secreted protein
MNRTLAAAAAIALSVPVCSLPANAGSISELEILGFSADASIFAFEEHGIQDGSGFPYANRFYIDVATDGFVAGTPIRVRIDEVRTVHQESGDASFAVLVAVRSFGFEGPDYHWIAVAGRL